MNISVDNGIMSPVDKSSCNLIYFIGVFCFVYAVITLLMGVYFMFYLMNIKSKDRGLIMINVGFNIFTVILINLLAYYLYRIQYTICLKVL